MRNVLAIALVTVMATGYAYAGTRDNDDSCDVKVTPAATLMLPYFEVDINPSVPGQTTLFTITNVTRYPQIAHVTLWTDWAYPVLNFNVFLTGYDVQAINLYDVLVRGIVAPPSGTTSATTPGAMSASNITGNPNLRSPLDCGGVPGNVPQAIMGPVRTALTTGVFRPSSGPACSTAGGVHANAIGYATIDLVASCTSRMPTDPLYYTTDLLYDNVLIGDYQQLGASPAGTGAGPFEAGGNPMVHIRAVPEGGGAGSVVGTSLPFTFYDLYTPATNRVIDRRQPLPATYAARWIQGGTSAFATNITMWREAETRPDASCASYVNNAVMVIGEIIRFDEHENPTTMTCFGFFGCGGPATFPATATLNTAGSYFPTIAGSPDVAGWLYFNASNCGNINYSVTTDIGGAQGPSNKPGSLAPKGGTTVYGPRPSQAWITVSMFGRLGTNRLNAEFDAASLGNGCSPAAFLTSSKPIAPAGGAFVCPPGTTLTNGTTTLCTGTNGNPTP
jgi:hypothetical protein